MVFKKPKTPMESAGWSCSGADYAALAKVVDALGTSSFYREISAFTARALDCQKRIVMRYSAFDTPVFLYNNAMSDDAVEFYLRGLFRIDPLRKLSRENRQPQVVNLRSMTSQPRVEPDYLEQIFKIAFIYDELAFLLPTVGGLTIAICCERVRGMFTDEDKDHANSLLPLIVSLHQRHLQSFFSNRRTTPQADKDDFTGAILILDAKGEPVFSSDAWRDSALTDAETARHALQERSEGAPYLDLGKDALVHWEDLDENSPLAPGGVILSAERKSGESIGISGEQAIQKFCEKYAITPREAEIFRLALLGFPNSRIASQLDISVGTVKNHRWRLYTKLDITTERELFHLFLAEVIAFH
ncbi:MAG: Response regulator containing a CheY-like receiver domain and an HTH DNA-binding domain [Rhodobacteraceae bacterium HLUCCA12]|nr:MAG: Response regulator containing a CheY-like receiver domain and an HTH DNA-binding domain [Rhodobacteraceae bacterium HLUCCA12]